MYVCVRERMEGRKGLFNDALNTLFMVIARERKCVCVCV